MTVDALWTQGTGATYSAAEDRKLIRSMFTDGVTRGLVVTKAGGRNLSVGEGAAVIPDGTGGAYLAYTETTKSLTIPDGATQNLYVVVVNPTGAGGGKTDVVAASSPPSDPNVMIGTAAAAGGSITSTDASLNGRAYALPHAMAPGSPSAALLLSGGTVSGPLGTQALTAAGLITANGGLFAPKGVRLGGANPTARHYCQTTAKAASASVNKINASVWEAVHWNVASGVNNVTDYTQTPMISADYAFYPGVAGGYMFSGYINFAGRSGGMREVRISVYSGTTVSYAMLMDEYYPSSATGITLAFDALVPYSPGQHVRIECYQNTASTLDITGGRCHMRLLQAN